MSKNFYRSIVRKIIWIVYYSFYLLPLNYYFRIKSLLGLSRIIKYEGDVVLGDKICIFVSYPVLGKISQSLKRYLLNLHQLGYSIIFISNNHIALDDIEELKSFCSKIIVRENYGKDFGAYKFGILEYNTQIQKTKELLIANDSVVHILDLKKMFTEMYSRNVDFWGISEAYHGGMYKNHHICSYFLVVSETILKSQVFWKFWEDYNYTNSRMNIIQFGEIEFSVAIQKAGFSSSSYINSSNLYQFLISNKENLPSFLNCLALERNGIEPKLNAVTKLLYTTNHNGIFVKAMIALGLPLVKKDLFSRCHYYKDEISLLLQNIEVVDFANIIKELVDLVPSNSTFKNKILNFIGEK